MSAGPLSVGVSGGPEILRDISSAVEAWEDMGYRSAWASEVAGPDFATVLGAIAASSKRSRPFELGVGVAPVQTRPAWLLAATASTIATLTGQAFNLGLGTSSDMIVEDWSGLSRDRPLTQVKETVEVLRRVLAGDRSDFEGGAVRSRRYRLPWLPDADVRVLIGATGPKALRQAGVIGDGVVLNLIAPEHIPILLTDVKAGNGSSVPAAEIAPRVVVLVYCLVTDNVAEERERIAAGLVSYVATRAYAQMLTRLGYGAEVEGVQELFQARRRREAAARVEESLLDVLAVVGSASQVVERIREYLDVGVDNVVVCPLTERVDQAMDTWRGASGAIG